MPIRRLHFTLNIALALLLPFAPAEDAVIAPLPTDKAAWEVRVLQAKFD